MNSGLTAFIAGVIFGCGLVISGMTQPAKVVGFLDVFGRWDPSLAFVMAGAIAVYAPIFRLSVRLENPWLATNFSLPTATMIDRRLLLGAMLFGIGWGLGGFCPGPAFTSLSSLSAEVLVFVPSMLVGFIIAGRLRRG